MILVGNYSRRILKPIFSQILSMIKKKSDIMIASSWSIAEHLDEGTL